MAIKLIRGDGRSVNAHNDGVAFDYAFGGQSGVVPNILNKLEYDASVLNTFKIKPGMGVIQGRQFIVEIDETIPLNVATGPTVFYYIIYAEMDMSAIVGDGLYRGSVTIKASQNTGSAGSGSYPGFPDSDNLNEFPTGKAYLPLYRFKKSSTAIIDIERAFDWIYHGGINEEKAFNKIATIANLTGDYNNSIIQQAGVLQKGWYEVELAAGGGGGAFRISNSKGGNGGYLSTKFFIQRPVNYKLMAGGGGDTNNNGGGGGGGSVLDIPQIGILLITTGGGGGGDEIHSGGGGGGGYGGGGSGGEGYGGFGGAGGGAYGGKSNVSQYDALISEHGSGSSGGSAGRSQNISQLKGSGGSSGGVGGLGGGGSDDSLGLPRAGGDGGNNINTSLGGGGIGGSNEQRGGNGYAMLYKLG